MTDFEVILVDDGSPDNCPQMCDSWATKDARITVIHKSNGGLSDARNAGIDVARGDYITFIDSDDYLGEGTLHAVMGQPGHADLLEYPAMLHVGSPRQRLLTFEDKTYDDVASYWLGTRAYQHTYAWNKVYRRQLFDGVRFPVGKVFEDAATLPLLLHRKPRVATTSQGMYYYTANQQGITATAQGIHLSQLLEAHLGSGMPVDNEYYLALLNIQLDVCRLTGQTPILPYRHISPFESSLAWNQRIKVFILNTFGINSLCRLNQVKNKIGH